MARGERIRYGSAALRLGAVHARQGPACEPQLGPLLESRRDFREQRTRGDRHDATIGQLPTELLGDLERERLRALCVVRTQVDVHERPLALRAQLRAQA